MFVLRSRLSHLPSLPHTNMLEKKVHLSPEQSLFLVLARRVVTSSVGSLLLKYVKPGVELLPPEETAVIPANRPSGEPYSATDARKMLEQGDERR